ncbi:TolC family protein [Silanimonas sp.]|uniref:efflux transporter outer membrane subunit n=1 Tax=Silanimonas sp. TaxID=1929290 RepID=UPI0022C8CB1B|nr:TolC family protein [Silanimonas sp.]MCZ8166402.1 TolC family protein [Silanimonas sp.]
MPKLHARGLALAITVALLAGCTVGPPHTRPDVSLPTEFDQASSEQTAAAPGTAVWQAFNDPALARLIERTLVANTTIAQAEARLAETRALSGLTRYSLFPTVTAATDAGRSRASNQDPFVPPGLGTIETYRAGFDATWELDLFGGLRNRSRAIHTRTAANAAELRSVRISMVAETAQTYFALRGAQRRLALAKENLAAADEVLVVIELLFENGRQNGVDFARARAQRSSLAANLPQREAELVAQEQRLAVLTAQPVAAVREQVGDARTFPELPTLVTAGTPEAWLQRRPDIIAAERRLAAARNDVGEEIAQYFPKLFLDGAFGWTGQVANVLGDRDAERWQWGPSLTWRFLDFGRVRQNVKAAEARADGSVAAYRETVLRALEETENALAGYRASNRAAIELGNAADAAKEASRLSRLRFEAGADDALTLLQTEQTRIDLEDAAVQAQTSRTTALAALYKALAGDFAEAAAPSGSDPGGHAP